MSRETFTEHVRSFYRWAESTSHDLETVRRLLPLLMEGAGPLKTSRPIFTAGGPEILKFGIAAEERERMRV